MPGSSSLGMINSGSRSMNRESTEGKIVESVRKNMNTTSVDTTPRLFSTYSTRVPRNKLIVWNFSLFLFHSMFAIITLYFGKIDLTVQVYKTQIGFSRRDINNTDAGWDLTPIYVEGGTFPITILTASFFVISAFFHLLNSSLLREYYLSELEKCRTPTRWIEYCFSAPLMILVISFTIFPPVF